MLARDIDVSRKSRKKGIHQLDFAAGSIETLKIIAEINEGVTILPSLAIKGMTARQKENIRPFKAPAPVREIGLVTYRHYVKEKLISVFAKEILACKPESMKSFRKKEIIGIHES